MLSVHVAALLFGLAGVLGAATGLNAMEVTFGRTLFATIALFVVSWWLFKFNAADLPVAAGDSKHLHNESTPKEGNRSEGNRSEGNLTQNNSLLLLLCSGLLLAFHWVCFFLCIQMSSVAIGLTTFSTCPVFLALLEPKIFNEPLKPVALVAALGVLCGVIVMSGLVHGQVQFGSAILIGLISGFSFAVLQLLNRRLMRSNGSIKISTVQNGVAALVLLPIVISALGAIQFKQWILLLVLGVGCTAIAHTLFIYSLQHVKAATAALIAAGLEPVYGVIFGVLLLSQVPGPGVLTGGLIILAFVVMTVYVQEDTQ